MSFLIPSTPAAYKTLAQMLRYKRPHKSEGEAQFIKRFILPLGAEADTFGNYWLKIGESPILWSSHTDTVHRTSGPQNITYSKGAFYSDSGECLGGDCTAGIWLMSIMARKKVPGLYIFHRGEECGGLGSRFIADKLSARLEGIKFAIALDRKGYGDIITDQMGVTASNDFAFTLARALAPLEFFPCNQGIFTDTANYSHIIPECTNISVGYHNAHCANEWQDAHYLLSLARQLCASDFSVLEAKREPVDHRYDDWVSSYYDKKAGVFYPKFKSLRDLVYEHPDEVANFLKDQGYTPDDLKNYCP